MERIELKVYGSRLDWNPCDAMMVSVFLNPNIVVIQKKWQLKVELSNANNRRGQLYDSSPNGTEVTIIQKINQQMFQQLILDTVSK